MTKYVSRIMDEVYDNFDSHFNGDAEEITWFLELDYYENFNEDDND